MRYVLAPLPCVQCSASAVPHCGMCRVLFLGSLQRYWDGDMDKLELLYSFDPSKRASALRPVQVEGAT